MPSKKYPWWRPAGVDVYVGVVLFHGEKVLLRHLDSKGYKWTFPRRKVREQDVDIEYHNACDLAESLGASLRRVVAVPGSWRGEASVSQYWRADASSVTAPAVQDAVAEAEAAFGVPTEELIEVAANFAAAGLPLSKCGKPLPLSPELVAFFVGMAGSLPDADPEIAQGNDLEWVDVSAVAHHLAQSDSSQGRRRDIAVWHAAQAVGRIAKPTEITGLGWRKQTILTKDSVLLSVSAERDEDLRRWPFNVPAAPIEYNVRAVESLRAANKAGWRLQACFTCRHLKCSGLATEAGGGWCTAARAPDDERRAAIPYSLGWCPNFEAALLSRGGVEARRDDPTMPKELTWSYLKESKAFVSSEVEEPSDVRPLVHSTFITSRLFSRLRPSYGIRLVPAEGAADRIGPPDRSFVCIGDYDEVKGHTVMDVANCLFGIDQPPSYYSPAFLSKKYAYPEVIHQWPAAWRAFLVRLHDDSEVDLFPGTWKSIAFIMQDKQRMLRNPDLYRSFREMHGGQHGYDFCFGKHGIDFLELDAEFQWSGSTQAGWYHYCSKDSGLANEIVREVGVANRCWHGRGYIGTAPDIRARVFLIKNLPIAHQMVMDLGVLGANDELPVDLDGKLV